MNEQNLYRIRTMVARHAVRAKEPPTAPPFLVYFTRVRDEVLRPVLADVGAELLKAGGPDHILPAPAGPSDGVALRLLIPGCEDSLNTIRFFPRRDRVRGWQVIGETEGRRSPTEIARFDADEPIRPGAVEQLVVNAVEQMLAAANSTD
jgi:hypothetical protein